MIVVITGGTGFIGRGIAEAHLDRGDEVRLLTRKSPGLRPQLKGAFTWYLGDLRSSAGTLRQLVSNADLIYHCAGEVHSRRDMDATNRVGTESLLAAAKGQAGRWIQLSSVGVYGPRSDGTVDERSPLAPQGSYEVSKAAAEALVVAAHQRGDVEAVIVRPSIIFGKGMVNSSLRQWTNAIRRGRFFFLGSPESICHYVPVQSVVEAMLLCGTHRRAPGRVFNVVEDASTEQLVQWMADECGVTPPRWRLPVLPFALLAKALEWMPGWPLSRQRIGALTNKARYLDVRIREDLGFRPSMSLEQALRNFVQDVKASAK